MSDDIIADLGLIARQQRLILSELGSVHDDMNVSTAIAMRQDPTLSALRTEVCAMHSQHNRLASRVRALEGEN